jgi:hypothetical protein
MKNLVLLGLTIAAAHAATITVSCVADTTLSGLKDDFVSFQDNNLGAMPWMNVGTTATGYPMRGLMKFDLSDIPLGATINSVAVKLSVVFTPGGPGSTFELHRVLQEWFEGNKGASVQFGEPATEGETTWNDRAFGSAPWAAPGATSSADIVLTPSSTVTMNGLARYVFAATPTLIADVQTWANNPSSNYGWLINSASPASQTARRIGSRESGSATAPTLEITFTPPAPLEPRITSFDFSVAGVTLTWTGGSAPYRIARADNINGPWTFVTPTTSATTATAPLGAVNGFYRVAGNAP